MDRSSRDRGYVRVNPVNALYLRIVLTVRDRDSSLLILHYAEVFPLFPLFPPLPILPVFPPFPLRFFIISPWTPLLPLDPGSTGYDRPCFPKKCCTAGNRDSSHNFSPPCVNSPRGYQSDHYLYRYVTALLKKTLQNIKGMRKRLKRRKNIIIIYHNPIITIVAVTTKCQIL